MPAPLQLIATAEDMPPSADCVVIGGGIVGTCAAYYLARAGKKVVLLEKGRIGAEQSSRNWGWCRQQNRDQRELPLATKSLELWDGIERDLDESTGFNRCGLLYLSNDEAEIEGWAKWGKYARGVGVDTRLLSAEEATARGAASGKTWKGGVWSNDDGVADPSRAAPAIALGIIKHGGTVLQNCAARGIERTGGKVSAVLTERGVIRTPQVVLAGGAWSSSFLYQLGIPFPQASIRSSILSVAPGTSGLPLALHTKNGSITRRSDGGYTLAISGAAQVDPTPGILQNITQFLPMFARRWRSVTPGGLQGWQLGFDQRRIWAPDEKTPMETVRILDPRPSRAQIRRTLAASRDLMPALKAVPVQAAWAGYIDSTPDGVPVIDGDIGVPGLLLAAGFSGHGFGIGPGAGHLIADILLGRDPITEIKQYRLARFGKSQWGKVSEF